MNLSFYTPKDPTLNKYIEGYYFICDNEKNSLEKYRTFPNNYCILTINLNSNIKCSINTIQVIPSPKQCLTVSCVHRYIHPIEVSYEKPVHEITLYFKPLGINCFTNDPSGLFYKNIITDIDACFQDLTNQMIKIFREPNRTLQVEALEIYLLSIFVYKDLPFVHDILAGLESNLKIEEVAKRRDISRKHLNSIVVKHLGKTAVEYRNIHRFRNTLKKYREQKNLTELSYENLFYDQSHFIKTFKSLTGLNPKSFFKNVDTEKGNIWFHI